MSIRVLFPCTGNSTRSQMAEHILRHLAGERFDAFSAGTTPRRIHPMTIRALNEIGIDADHAQSKGLESFDGQHFDYIITVCDRVRDNCPTFPGDSKRYHWGFTDPAAFEGSEEAVHNTFCRVRDEITRRTRVWIAVVDKPSGR
ncbi:MAG TPA: arsenate reductase ArsC [Mariprofundaceae bacterium]|nr:arsenate reductase ArsC [Mariprofundaceae bacterium]